jgi:hypothetical protein
MGLFSRSGSGKSGSGSGEFVTLELDDTSLIGSAPGTGSTVFKVKPVDAALTTKSVGSNSTIYLQVEKSLCAMWLNECLKRQAAPRPNLPSSVRQAHPLSTLNSEPFSYSARPFTLDPRSALTTHSHPISPHQTSPHIRPPGGTRNCDAPAVPLRCASPHLTRRDPAVHPAVRGTRCWR